MAGADDLPSPLSDTDFPAVDIGEARLGRLLFYDPILSGNKKVSCATCHHPHLGTSDGLSVGIGDGGQGLGPHRVSDPDNPPEQRIPRNAPGLFNLGAKQVRVLFYDGRIERDETSPSGFRTPMGREMEQGFDGLLSAQTMFPVLSADEMAGHYGENAISKVVRSGRITGPDGAWDLLARRVAALPGYQRRFATVYGLGPDEIHFTDISNAIAVFMAHEWRSDTSPFDAYLRGQGRLSERAMTGLRLFYGAGGCADCHSGPLLTDQRFHAMGDVQIGPGKAARFERHARDIGRMRVTGDPNHAYAFRTPSLRNVALTAPYGHAGAYADLAAYLRHHADPVAGLEDYDRDQAVLPKLGVADWRILEDTAEVDAIAGAVTRAPVDLEQTDVAALVAFLEALTDPVARTGRLGVPEAVPSGLPVAQPLSAATSPVD
jgi:cytochrome c peroxidase